MNYKKHIVFICLLLAFMGCRNEMDKPTQLKLSLCLPIQERVLPQQNRVMGDPGASEAFELPKYAYIFVMKLTGTDTWEVWRLEERILNDANWERTRYYGLNETRGDSIYKYNGDISFLLKNETPSGRVYAVCSKKKLQFSETTANIDNLEKLLNWKFDTSPDSIQEDLQNIYSTPYNYNRDGSYYCSFDCSTGNFYHVDLLMYHVASKVDITWNVADSVRIHPTPPAEAVRLTYMDAQYLYNDWAYCFRPMENETSAILTSGRTIPLIRPTDEGLWWEGRSYFYTIPYTVSGSANYFPLQMLMRTNDSGGTGYQPTIKLRIDTSSPFVPWLRANFNISTPLTDGAVEKIADN